MGDDESGARPGRLIRFEDFTDGLGDGLQTRIGALESALDTYATSCPADYRVETDGTAEMVVDLKDEITDWGTWVADVGWGIVGADEGDPDLLQIQAVQGDLPMEAPNEQIEAHLADEWDDPYRNIDPETAELIAADLLNDDDTYNPDGPPAWVTYMGDGGNLSGVVSASFNYGAAISGLPIGAGPMDVAVNGRTVTVSQGGEVLRTFSRSEAAARLRLPRAGVNASRLSRAAGWFSRVGTVVGAGSNGLAQWYQDEGLETSDRLVNAGTVGAFSGGGAVAGSYIGGAVGTLCGPGAPVCVPAGSFLGGLAGGWLGGTVGGNMPWVEDPPAPMEVDPDHVAELIGGEGQEPDLVFSNEEINLALDGIGDPVPRWHLENLRLAGREPRTSLVEIPNGEPTFDARQPEGDFDILYSRGTIGTPSPPRSEMVLLDGAEDELLDNLANASPVVASYDINNITGSPVAIVVYRDTDTGDLVEDNRSHAIYAEVRDVYGGIASPEQVRDSNAQPSVGSHRHYMRTVLRENDDGLESIHLRLSAEQRNRLGHGWNGL